MRKKIILPILTIFFALNTQAMPLTDADKVNLAISRANQTFNLNLTDLKSQILENSLSYLSHQDEINHENITVLNELEKTMPTKKQKDKIAILVSILLSQLENP